MVLLQFKGDDNLFLVKNPESGGFLIVLHYLQGVERQRDSTVVKQLNSLPQREEPSPQHEDF